MHPAHTVSFDYPPEAPRTLTIRSNSHGFRQVRELGEEDVPPHVLVTGDSFNFGQGVEDSERFTDRVEALRPELRVDNVGMTGWGPDMMLLAPGPIHRDTALHFIPYDSHYTPAGHAVVAAALAPVLDSLVRHGAETS